MKRFAFCLVGIFLLLSLASAGSFELDEDGSSVEENYLEGDFFRGVLNMSFSEQLNEDFSHNLGDEKTKLIGVLEAMGYVAGEDYECGPVSCKSTYRAYDPEGTKGILLGEEKRLYGFKIESNNPITEINKLEFEVGVYAPIHCVNQIYIDLFDDGTVDFFNTRPYGNVAASGCYEYPYESGKGFITGCFDPEEAENRVFLERDPYCQLMKDIPASGAYGVGGTFKIHQDGGNIGFHLYSADGECELLGSTGMGNLNTGGSPEKLIQTNLTYPTVETFDAFLCVNTDEEFEEDYISILFEDEDELCGMPYVGPPCVTESYDFTADYDLFIKPLGYGYIEELTFDDDLYDDIYGRNLEKDVLDYLNDTYDLDCSGDGCVIPMTLWGQPPEAGASQSINSVDLKYKPRGSGIVADNKIYDLVEKPAEVTSDYLEIFIEELEFEVPDEDGHHTFTLSLGGEEVIEERVNVEIGFSFHVTPRFAFIGRETAFIAKTSKAIAESIWDFDDGTSPVRVSGNSVKHTFTEAGEYGVKVTLIREHSGSGTPKNSSKRFKVVVGRAKESVELTLRELEARIENLESNISTYPGWVGLGISSVIGLDNKKALVETKKQEFESLDNESDEAYVALMNDLLGIELPYRIYTSESGTLPADFGYDGANMAHLEALSEATVEDKEELKAHVFDFMYNHYQTDIYVETISALGEFGETVDLLKTYKITISEIESPGAEPVYLIIGQPKSSITFASGNESFSSTGVSGGTYTDLGSGSFSSVEFMITGLSAPDVENLGVYLSPPATTFELSGGEDDIVKCWFVGEDCEFEEYSYLWSWTGLGILLLVFLIVYILLQTWYKRNYEKHLFPNPNDLYNLLNFIYNSRRNGLKDSDTKKVLKQRNWTGEQVTYAFKKLEGKRTGMWEIPIFKFLENKKVKRELKKKQGGRPLDTRFIKRPNL